jgi:hypothetical protein
MRLRAIGMMVGIAFALVGCGGWSLDLPNGYEYIGDGGLGAIANPRQSVVIRPDIAKLAIVGDVVTGWAEVPDRMRHEGFERKEPGYFVLDTASGWSVDNLSEQAWRRAI